jgi:hypothetical protein
MDNLVWAELKIRELLERVERLERSNEVEVTRGFLKVEPCTVKGCWVWAAKEALHVDGNDSIRGRFRSRPSPSHLQLEGED